jgi:cathepsin B
MKAYLLLLIAITQCDYIEGIINRAQTSADTWTPTTYEQNIFQGMTFQQIQAMFPNTLNELDFAQIELNTGDNDLHKKDHHLQDVPANFDVRTKWADCIHPVRYQGTCGSCYAHATTEVMSDRFCIESGIINKVLSVQDPVSCAGKYCYYCSGCPYQIWKYLTLEGTVTEQCFPYVSANGYVPQCSIKDTQKCANVSEPFKKYKVKKGSIRLPYLDREEAMKEIYLNGPIAAHMFITPEYLTYKSGVFVPTSTTIIGSHLVKIIGWGYDVPSKLNYWLVQDSMGVEFGMNGYSMVMWGANNIDSHMSWAQMDLSS